MAGMPSLPMFRSAGARQLREAGGSTTLVTKTGHRSIRNERTRHEACHFHTPAGLFLRLRADAVGRLRALRSSAREGGSTSRACGGPTRSPARPSGRNGNTAQGAAGSSAVSHRRHSGTDASRQGAGRNTPRPLGARDPRGVARGEAERPRGRARNPPTLSMKYSSSKRRSCAHRPCGADPGCIRAQEILPLHAVHLSQARCKGRRSQRVPRADLRPTCATRQRFWTVSARARWKRASS